MNTDGPTVAIVQARLGSTRLPAKVLAPLEGQPVLHRVMSRLARCQTVDLVVIATTWLSEDDPLEAYANSCGWAVTRGHPSDLLTRYVTTAKAYSANTVIRVTSDCPLIDPGVVDDVVRRFGTSKPAVDYASNTLEPPTFPRGLDVEVMSFGALMVADASDADPGTREHVTPYLKEASEFRRLAVSNEIDRSNVRWTVDTPEDLEALRLVYGYFGGDDGFTWQDALSAWDAHPAWARINAGVEQKPVVRQLPTDA